ncbi:MAG: hypothetical protein MI866_12935 [Bacteroidales bacterium]|nr:hypothetical protein [Bacteroidales bacterium]
MKNINLRNLFRYLVAISFIVSLGCSSDDLPSVDEVIVNENSKIIGETAIRVGGKATYMLNVPGAKDYQWSFPSSAPVTNESKDMLQSTLTLKGKDEGKFRLSVSYSEEGYPDWQEKYITVIVYE